MTNALVSGRRLSGAIIGAVVAGLILSVWMLTDEVTTHAPSQLTQMERQIASWFGGTTPLEATTITGREEYLGNLGHWLLSATVGAVYPFTFRQDERWVFKGLLFGAGFFIAAHAIVGPLLGLTPGMWNMPRSVFLTGCLINGFFGLSTAFFAQAFIAGVPRSTSLPVDL